LYVKSLRIQNLKCFREASLELQFRGRMPASPSPALANVNLLLGDNGTGKTTVLKAIALAALSRVMERSGYTPYWLVRRGATAADVQATLVLHGQDVGSKTEELRETSVRTRIFRPSLSSAEWISSPFRTSPIWERMYEERSPAFFLAGYGATRRVAGSQEFDRASLRKLRAARYQRVASIFEDHVALAPLNAWLPRLLRNQSARAREAVTLINRLLPGATRFRGEIENGEIVFSHRGVNVPVAALSDGYRAFVGWLSDLLLNLCTGLPSHMRIRDVAGVVLVDEIDLHLHPSWQREVIPKIAAALPTLQFIFSSHSSIVAGTLMASNIFRMEPAPRGAATVSTLTAGIHGLNADQILTGPYFGLPSTRAEGHLHRLRSLAARAAAGDRSAGISFLDSLASGSEAGPAKIRRARPRKRSKPASR